MSEAITNNKELLKFPIMVASIVLGLWCLDIMGYSISELGPNGAKINKAKEQAQIEIQQAIENHDEIMLLKAEVNAIRSKLDSGVGSQLSVVNMQEDLLTENIENVQMVSTQFAQKSIAAAMIGFTEGEERTLLYNKSGYIWIGEALKDSTTWTKVNLTNINGGSRPIWENEKMNGEYLVTGNLVLRNEKPEKSETYYKSIGQVGVIPSGTKVLLEGKPIPFQRNKVTQFWAKVKVLE